MDLAKRLAFGDRSATSVPAQAIDPVRGVLLTAGRDVQSLPLL